MPNRAVVKNQPERANALAKQRPTDFFNIVIIYTSVFIIVLIGLSVIGYSLVVFDSVVLPPVSGASFHAGYMISKYVSFQILLNNIFSMPATMRNGFRNYSRFYGQN